MTTLVLTQPPPRRRELQEHETIDHDVEDAKFIGASWDKSGHVWLSENGKVTRPGVPNFQAKPVGDWGSVAEIIRNSIPGKSVTLHQMTLAPGQYYPRVARPNDQHPMDFPGAPNFARGDSGEVFGSARHFSALMNDLEFIFDCVQPSGSNFDCHGNRIRNLLLLACTECENQMRGVLRANGMVKDKDRFFTYDFAKLLTPMRLDEYIIEFAEMPWLGEFAPFSGWDPGNATASLPWYEAYNSSKHDRTKNLHRASLKVTLDALAALWILLSAQYGVRGWHTQSGSDRTFKCIAIPRWRYSDVYTYPYEGSGRSAEAVKLFS